MKKKIVQNRTQKTSNKRALDRLHDLLLDEDYCCAECSKPGIYVVRWRTRDGIGRRRVLCQDHTCEQLKACYAMDWDPAVTIKENPKLALLAYISAARTLRDKSTAQKDIGQKDRTKSKRTRLRKR